MNGNGLLPSGGGLARGLGLPSGGGLDSGGFKSRRPAVQVQMLSGMHDQVQSAKEMFDELHPDNFTNEDGSEITDLKENDIMVPKKNCKIC